MNQFESIDSRPLIAYKKKVILSGCSMADWFRNESLARDVYSIHGGLRLGSTG
jgi:hypothetical protein